MLDAAIRIVNTKCGDFNPEVFQGEYEDALKELIEKKAKGERIETAEEARPRARLWEAMFTHWPCTQGAKSATKPSVPNYTYDADFAYWAPIPICDRKYPRRS